MKRRRRSRKKRETQSQRTIRILKRSLKESDPRKYANLVVGTAPPLESFVKVFPRKHKTQSAVADLHAGKAVSIPSLEKELFGKELPDLPTLKRVVPGYFVTEPKDSDYYVIRRIKIGTHKDDNPWFWTTFSGSTESATYFESFSDCKAELESEALNGESHYVVS